MLNITFAFIIAAIIGGIGIWYMVLGAHESAAGDYKAMSTLHLLGIVALTMTAAIVWYDKGDSSYVLMQLPFVVGTVQTFLRRHPKSRTIRLYRFVGWWQIRWALLINAILIVTGYAMGIVGNGVTAMQVFGAAAASTGLAQSDVNRILKLGLLAVGRLLLCVSSGWKFLVTFDNAAALVWAVLMGWAFYETCRAWRKVWSEVPA